MAEDKKYSYRELLGPVLGVEGDRVRAGEHALLGHGAVDVRDELREVPLRVVGELGVH